MFKNKILFISIIILVVTLFSLFSCDLALEDFENEPVSVREIESPWFYPIPGSGSYTDVTVDVTISTTLQNAVIYITIDGSNPSEDNFHKAGNDKPESQRRRCLSIG